MYPAVETHIEDFFIAVPYIYSPQRPSCARAGQDSNLTADMSLTTYLRHTLLISAVKHPTSHTGISLRRTLQAGNNVGCINWSGLMIKAEI